MGRDEKSFRRLFQDDFQEISRVQPEDGPAVRLQVAYPAQPGCDALR